VQWVYLLGMASGGSMSRAHRETVNTFGDALWFNSTACMLRNACRASVRDGCSKD
jgi:hypothetical protein